PVVADAHHQPGHQGGGGAQELSLGAAPNPIVLDRGTVLSGRLKGTNKVGRTVTLDGAPHPFTSFTNNIATTTTSASGDFSFTRRPRLHTRYRVRVGNLFSPGVTVLVRQRVSLFLSDRTPRRGQLVRFSGRSCPAHDGAVVSIQKRTSTGGWRTVRRTRLREASRCSVYSRRLRVYTDGTFRTVVASDADHARGFSRRRSADAHR
ncbi:MAG: hypothetical protein LC808_05995, partial [Actinobacteria bacterium]|nr:hypothetical protein [Actinomycetota bacterium]